MAKALGCERSSCPVSTGKLIDMTRIALLALFAALSVTLSAQAPPPTFELPAPTGKSPIGTTRWVVTDVTRDEIFAPGKKRDIEIVAWYPAAAATGQPAPYLRDGMEEVLSFARLAKLGDAFNGLASVKTHATIDAPPGSGREAVDARREVRIGSPAEQRLGRPSRLEA